MRAIPNDLISQYELNVRKCYYSRNNYFIDTDSARYVLRKVNITPEQIMFVNEALVHLKNSGFSHVNSIHETKKKLPYAINRGQVYVLQDRQDGEDIEFNKEEDVAGMIRLLAQFHKSGVNFESEHRKSENVHLKDLYTHLKKRHRETQILKKKVVPLSQKTTFEILFLKGYKPYEDLQKMAIECIDGASCDRVMGDVKIRKSLAHNDYKYHAVSRVGNSYNLIQIDQCTYNIQILDLSSILIKIMQKNKWDTKLLMRLIEEYENVRKMSPEEKSLLKAMLIFPEKYSSLCNKYLQCKRRGNYSMYEVKWNNMLAYLEDQVSAAHFIKDNL